MLKEIIKNRKGTALLVALLVMGVLMAISLALSTLILREIVVTKDLLDSGRAYYAAESGVEIALYNLENKLPGWEPVIDASGSGYKSFKVDGLAALGEVKVKNRCKAYPCFDEEEFDIGSATPRQFYDILELNESINIPLFVVEKGVSVPVTDFVVEFYATFDPATDLNFNAEKLSGWDVLRWKVFGITTKEPKVTETISDFTALSTANKPVLNPDGSQDTEKINTNATLPSWFGTKSCNELLNSGQKESRYQTKPAIQCAEYGAAFTQKMKVDGQIADVFAGTCRHDEAREYYQYNYGATGDKQVVAINGCYRVKDFLANHKLNYLSLTNLINPAVFKDDLGEAKVDAFSKLYYRVELFTDNGAGETAREVADITSNGYSGDNNQSINVKIRKGSFMPVFHFSLYSTYKEAGHGDDYWYEDKTDKQVIPY